MYWDEHPPPHFHVRYGNMRASIDILTGTLIEGELPRKKLQKIEEWRKLHSDELLKEPGRFIRFSLSHGTIAWSYELDISPRWLYEHIA